MNKVFGYLRELPAIDLVVQIAVGFWLSVMVWISITLKSWNVAIDMVLIAAFFMLPSICISLWKSKNAWLRNLAKLIGIGFVAVILFGLLMWVEKIYYEHSDSYPAWLATEVSAQDSNLDNVLKLRDGACKNYGMLVFDTKPDGKFYARCGQFFYNSKTFIFPVAPLVNMTDSEK